MEPERWREIEQLYHAARECPPGQRDQFLKKACEDERVRNEVGALLECEEQAEGFLEAPALELTAEALAEGRSRSMLGRVLGHYEIVAFIGAGGMGEVYRARDSRIGRDVAIKVLPPGVAASNPERLLLFEQEARAAARDQSRQHSEHFRRRHSGWRTVRGVRVIGRRDATRSSS